MICLDFFSFLGYFAGISQLWFISLSAFSFPFSLYVYSDSFSLYVVYVSLSLVLRFFSWFSLSLFICNSLSCFSISPLFPFRALRSLLTLSPPPPNPLLFYCSCCRDSLWWSLSPILLGLVALVFLTFTNSLSLCIYFLCLYLSAISLSYSTFSSIFFCSLSVLKALLIFFFFYSSPFFLLLLSFPLSHLYLYVHLCPSPSLYPFLFFFFSIRLSSILSPHTKLARHISLDFLLLLCLYCQSLWFKDTSKRTNTFPYQKD